ncbi:hypothetical protein [Flavobacterium sp. HNIBRBA15423]|uniref:hypothetical protein n=1 Tax=Flavobacterium sp. HNIBRBA15423 TaxID=3458683 RepID=UPI00404424D2
MKDRPVLISVIILSLIIELILIVLVYNKIGTQRLPSQIGRLSFQLIFIMLILTRRSNISLFVLTAYHIFTGLFILYSSNSTEWFGKILIIYHFGIGILIYFHDWIESKLKKEKHNP